MTGKFRFALVPLIVMALSFVILGSSWASDAATSKDSTAVPDSTVVVFYFHRTVRCHTCLTIEALAKETLETYFAEDMETGRLAWRPTDIEALGNEHFEDDFQLEFSSLIVTASTPHDGVSWWNLERIWDLVEQRDDFIEYVRLNVSGVLEKGAPPEPKD